MAILQLIRYDFNMTNHEIEKNHKHVTCSPNLLMPSGRQYFLKALISHIGENTRSGHYTVTLNDANSGENILLDDSRVTYLPRNTIGSSSNLSYIFVYESNN